MKSACYDRDYCDFCFPLSSLRESPGDYRTGVVWIDSWGLYRAAVSGVCHDPRGRCGGCRSVRINSCKVLALFLHKLGIRFDIHYPSVNNYSDDSIDGMKPYPTLVRMR